MKWQRLVAVAAASAAVAAAIAIPSAANADPNNPTFVSTPMTGNYSTTAYDLVALGLLNIFPTTSAACSANGQHFKHNSAALLSVPTPIGGIGVATSECTTVKGSESHPPYGSAEADIANLNLFGGKVIIKLISSRCSTGFDSDGYPIATVGSTYGSLVTNSNYATNGTGAIVIPGLATVAVDVNTNFSHNGVEVATTDAVVITLLAGNPLHLPAQLIVIGSCSITGHNYVD